MEIPRLSEIKQERKPWLSLTQEILEDIVAVYYLFGLHEKYGKNSVYTRKLGASASSETNFINARRNNRVQEIIARNVETFVEELNDIFTKIQQEDQSEFVLLIREVVPDYKMNSSVEISGGKRQRSPPDFPSSKKFKK